MLALGLIANAFVSVVSADEHPKAGQSVLSNPTISGSVVAEANIAEDSSAFSPSQVPEPSTIGFLAMGTATLAVVAIARRRWNPPVSRLED